MYKNVALISRPAQFRREETGGVGRRWPRLGCSVNWIWEPAPWTAVTSLKVGDTIYVSRAVVRTGRVQQLRAAFEPLGARVVAVPVSKVLHLSRRSPRCPTGR